MLDAGCWILDAGCWMLDAGCWMLDAGCLMLGARYWILARKLYAETLKVGRRLPFLLVIIAKHDNGTA